MKHCVILIVLMSCMSLYGCTGSYVKKKQAPKEEPVMSMDVDNLQLELQSAEVQYQTRNYSEASRLYKKILQTDPKNVKALYRVGNIEFRSQNWKEARNYYEQVIELSPQHTRAQYNLSMTYLTLAERHLKFYAANVDSSANISSVTQLITALEEISNPGSSTRSRSKEDFKPSSKPEDESLNDLLEQLSQ